MLLRQPQEVRQAFAAILLKTLRPLVQHPQISLTQFTLGQRANRCIIAAVLHHLPDKVAQAHSFRLEPPGLQLFLNFAALISQKPFRRAYFSKCFMESHISAHFCRPDRGKIRVREGKGRHFQRGYQGNILQRIIDDTQQRLHCLDFWQVKEGRRTVIKHGNARPPQQLHQLGRGVGGRRQQNHHVTVGVIAQSVAIIKLLIQQGLDALDHHLCFGFQCLDSFAVFSGGHIQQVHLHRRAVLPFPATNEFINGVVGQLRHGRTHGFAEDLIGRIQHIVPAAEVLLKDNSPAFCVLIV